MGTVGSWWWSQLYTFYCFTRTLSLGESWYRAEIVGDRLCNRILITNNTNWKQWKVYMIVIRHHKARISILKMNNTWQGGFPVQFMHFKLFKGNWNLRFKGSVVGTVTGLMVQTYWVYKQKYFQESEVECDKDFPLKYWFSIYQRMTENFEKYMYF